jgi:hypothetical protein
MSKPVRKQASSSVRSEVKRRGRALNNIWSVFSPKTQRQWILHSDLAEEHWLLLEADSHVVSFDLPPFQATGGDPHTDLSSDVDAIVRMRSGAVEWRQIQYVTAPRSEAAIPEITDRQADRGLFSHVVITDEQLSEKALLIRNFRQVVAAQRRTAAFPPIKYRNAAAEWLRTEGWFTLGAFIEGLDPAETALALSGAYSLLTSGIAVSDLDVAPLSTRTQLWLRE